MAISLFLFTRPLSKKEVQLSESLADSLRNPDRSEAGRQLEEQLAEQTETWRSALAEADRLAANLNRGQIALRSLEESQRRAGNDFLSQLSLYADIDNVNDADYVLDALRNQRQSESSYDESVSEFLRQIADVRKGRTDEDMLREYEHACEELYGAMLAGDDTGNKDVNLRSQSLKYDKSRARRIEIERVELSQDISRHKQQLKELKETLKQEEEFLDQVPRLSGEEAARAVIEQGAILLDTRTDGQYEVSHIEGAIKLPLAELDQVMKTLDKDAWYITYCT